MQGYYQGDYHLSTISWERSTTWGVGIDFTLFGGLTGSIDYYNRKTTDIIMDVSAPAEFALGKYKDNIGALRNEGVEISLAYAKQLNKDWAINAGVNFAYNKNKILNLGEGTEYIEKGNRRTALGQQYNSYYMYKATGKFFNSQEEADAFTAKYGNPFGRKFMAGDIIYEDTNGDGKLDSNDRVYTKHTDIPAITYNINLGATWKGFDLSMTWQGVGRVSHIINREVPPVNHVERLVDGEQSQRKDAPRVRDGQQSERHDPCHVYLLVVEHRLPALEDFAAGLFSSRERAQRHWC